MLDSSKPSLSQFRDRLKCLGMDLANSVCPAPDFSVISFDSELVTTLLLVVVAMELPPLVIIVLLVVVLMVFVTTDPLFTSEVVVDSSVTLFAAFSPSLLGVSLSLSAADNEDMDDEEDEVDEGITLRSMFLVRDEKSSSVLLLYFCSSCNKQSFVLVAASSINTVLWLSGAFCGTSRLVIPILIRLHLSIHEGCCTVWAGLFICSMSRVAVRTDDELLTKWLNVEVVVLLLLLLLPEVDPTDWVTPVSELLATKTQLKVQLAVALS